MITLKKLKLVRITTRTSNAQFFEGDPFSFFIRDEWKTDEINVP